MAWETPSTSGNKTSSKKTLKRFKFKLGDKSYKFILNPESYTQTENGKVSVTKTKGGAFVEMFGSDIVEIEFSGVTGFKNGTGDAESGFNKFKELRDLVKSVHESIKDGSAVSDDKLLWFYNYTDAEYWKCVPDKFELSRSKSQPLLYHYSIHLYAVKKIGEASSSSSSKQTVGSPTGTISTKKSTDDIAYEVIQGKWGNGEERRKKLTNAGYDYNTIQSRVNEILKKK